MHSTSSSCPQLSSRFGLFHTSTFLKLVKSASNCFPNRRIFPVCNAEIVPQLTMDLLYANQMMHCAFSCTLTIILNARVTVLTTAENVFCMGMVCAQKRFAHACLRKPYKFMHKSHYVSKLHPSLSMTLYMF